MGVSSALMTLVWAGCNPRAPIISAIDANRKTAAKAARVATVCHGTDAMVACPLNATTSKADASQVGPAAGVSGQAR